MGSCARPPRGWCLFISYLEFFSAQSCITKSYKLSGFIQLLPLSPHCKLSCYRPVCVCRCWTVPFSLSFLFLLWPLSGQRHPWLPPLHVQLPFHLQDCSNTLHSKKSFRNPVCIRGLSSESPNTQRMSPSWHSSLSIVHSLHPLLLDQDFESRRYLFTRLSIPCAYAVHTSDTSPMFLKE